ncbi:LysR substrate-binding domain-containing protein [Marivita hallyeonensis]|uniref:Transcriptional regulator, LysR family n=1 Tax=Marivita hallyeonensis TaxID=996342 RepID=A0A1M5W353_9RHOB|nr:LysR substrate-binding domain-containing protein [Marivita hallyeonensis]SHH81901.1 transcriptional regulator, LysR family [Marivita hallyeonensis]
MRDLPLTLLRALAAVYETGGIRPAGRLLGIQHSAVSRALRDLEAWLEVPLFEKRDGQRALVFSADGAALGKAALSAMRDLETAVLNTREGSSANSVTIATTPSFAMRWLLSRLPRLTDTHPKIEVSILVDQARKSPMATGADLNIRMGAQPSLDVDPIPLMDERVFPVMAPGLWEKLGRPSKIDELLNLPLLHDRDPSTSWGTWRRQFGPERLDVRKGPRLTSSDLILRAAEQGQGVALARGRLAEESLANTSLLRPFGDVELDLGDNYWIIANPETGRRRVVQTVIAWLLSEAQMGSEEVAIAVSHEEKDQKA